MLADSSHREHLSWADQSQRCPWRKSQSEENIGHRKHVWCLKVTNPLLPGFTWKISGVAFNVSAERWIVGAALRLPGKDIDSWSPGLFLDKAASTSDGIKHVCTDLVTGFQN